MAGYVENGGGRRGFPWRMAAWGAAALVLLLPLVAMQFSLVGVIALVGGGFGPTDPNWPLDVVGLTGFFVALFARSAFLFRKAAQEQPPAGAGRTM